MSEGYVHRHDAEAGAKFPISKKNMAVKIGPWGAAGGTPCDINMYSCPRSFRSIRIWSDDTPGGCIKGLSFTYEDQTALPITVNIGGCTSSCTRAHENRNTSTIGAAWSPKCYRGNLKELYVVLEHTFPTYHVSGTYNKEGVTSLWFLTNFGMKFGPYGWPSGTEFSLSLRAGCKVAAFFGNAGDNHSLKSLGLYVHVYNYTLSFQNTICVGPWGPSSGVTFYRKWNDKWNRPTSYPDQLQSITVRSSERSGGCVYGFSFTYLDEDGTSICSQWGSKTRGQNHAFCMNKDNYITSMGGTYDEYGITSLRFISTQDNYGPFGCSIGTPFSMLLQNNAALVSFFGEFNDQIITSIGAFVVPEADEPDHTESHTNQTHWIDRVLNKIVYNYGSWSRKPVTKPDRKM